MMRSIDIWVKRYKENMSLGSDLGSKGNLLEFKTSFINKFIFDNDIDSVIDFGHGDLSVASLLNAKEYIGIDIFDASAIHHRLNKSFSLAKSRFDEYSGQPADLVICLDVLYHLLEEEQIYMIRSLDKMIESCNRFLIIYAQDSREFHDYSSHMYNSKWLQYCLGQSNLKLVFEQEQCEPNSSAKFFIFQKADNKRADK